MTKIVVAVKYVPDATANRSFSADNTVDRDGVDGLLSELDEYAVEQALQVIEAGEGEVTVLTVGPDDAADAIRKALQMGADAGVHVKDDAIHGSDAFATSLVLAEAIKKLDYDLLFFGMTSTDGGMGVVPTLVAERLGVPAVTFASEVTVDGDTVKIRRDGDICRADGRGNRQGRRERHRPDRRSPLPVVQGHHGREEERRPGMEPRRPRP